MTNSNKKEDTCTTTSVNKEESIGLLTEPSNENQTVISEQRNDCRLLHNVLCVLILL